jgi:predicted O-methyltransferase YrrM
MVDELLAEIYSAGLAHDSKSLRREDRMVNITPSTGQFLDVLIRDAKPTNILELGTSNGYSTIWMARAAKHVGAQVTSVDSSALKSAAAKLNLERAGLGDQVILHTCDAGAFLTKAPRFAYDFVFLDCARKHYLTWANDLLLVTRFGTMVVDNSLSHFEDIREFYFFIKGKKELESCLLPIGKGQLLIREAKV